MQVIPHAAASGLLPSRHSASISWDGRQAASLDHVVLTGILMGIHAVPKKE
jgi:hypothetical protein